MCVKRAIQKMGIGFGFVSYLMILLLVTPAYAHQCILKNNSAEEISRYNNCKADLALPNIHQENADDKNSQQDLKALQTENARLKRQLDYIRGKLIDLLRDL